MLVQARGGRTRHIVFASNAGGRSGHVLNLTPGRDPIDTKPSRYARTALSHEQRIFVEWLFERAGLEAASYRPESLRRRLAACFRTVRGGSIAEARHILQHNPALIPAAVSSMIIGVSSFFRDADVFDRITFHVLPRLRNPSGSARIWSAGCSDGQELFSLAMLLAEMQMLDSCQLLGTDCRIDAIAHARDGCFDESALASVPSVWKERYFVKEAARWRIAPRLRTAIQWRKADVTRIHEPGLWDLILCRNVAMYLRPESSGRVWQTLEQALRPGGYLVLGKAERPLGANRLSMVEPCIYRRALG